MSFNKYSKLIIGILFCFTLIFGKVILNENKKFQVEIDELTKVIYDGKIKADIKINLHNKENEEILVNIENILPKDWVLENKKKEFLINPNSNREIELNFYFEGEIGEYIEKTLDNNEIELVIVPQSKTFVLKTNINSSNGEKISFSFQVIVDKSYIEKKEFPVNILTKKISLDEQILFEIDKKKIIDEKFVSFKFFLNNIEIKNNKKYLKKNGNKFQLSIPNSFPPKNYEFKLIVNKKNQFDNIAKEWIYKKNIEVIESKNLNIKKEVNEENFFYNENIITIKNNGNVKDIYVKELDYNILNAFFFEANYDYELNINSITFKIPIETSSTIILKFHTDYKSLYLLLFIIFLIILYILYKKYLGPLKIKVDLYDLKTSQFNHFESARFKVHIKNVSNHNFDEARIIVPIPNYLKISQNDFSVTKPDRIFRTDKYYRMIWDFPNFMKKDERIISFKIDNYRNIVSDINFDNLEVELYKEDIIKIIRQKIKDIKLKEFKNEE